MKSEQDHVNAGLFYFQEQKSQGSVTFFRASSFVITHNKSIGIIQKGLSPEPVDEAFVHANAIPIVIQTGVPIVSTAPPTQLLLPAPAVPAARVMPPHVPVSEKQFSLLQMLKGLITSNNHRDKFLDKEAVFYRTDSLNRNGTLVKYENELHFHTEGQAYTQFLLANEGSSDAQGQFDKITIGLSKYFFKIQKSSIRGWTPGSLTSAADADVFNVLNLQLAAENVAAGKWAAGTVDVDYHVLTKQASDDFLNKEVVIVKDLYIPVSGIQPNGKSPFTVETTDEVIFQYNPSYSYAYAANKLNHLDPRWSKVAETQNIINTAIMNDPDLGIVDWCLVKVNKTTGDITVSKDLDTHFPKRSKGHTVPARIEWPRLILDHVLNVIHFNDPQSRAFLQLIYDHYGKKLTKNEDDKKNKQEIVYSKDRNEVVHGLITFMNMVNNGTLDIAALDTFKQEVLGNSFSYGKASYDSSVHTFNQFLSGMIVQAMDVYTSKMIALGVAAPVIAGAPATPAAGPVAPAAVLPAVPAEINVEHAENTRKALNVINMAKTAIKWASLNSIKLASLTLATEPILSFVRGFISNPFVLESASWVGLTIVSSLVLTQVQAVYAKLGDKIFPQGNSFWTKCCHPINTIKNRKSQAAADQSMDMFKAELVMRHIFTHSMLVMGIKKGAEASHILNREATRSLELARTGKAPVDGAGADLIRDFSRYMEKSAADIKELPNIGEVLKLLDVAVDADDMAYIQKQADYLMNDALTSAERIKGIHRLLNAVRRIIDDEKARELVSNFKNNFFPILKNALIAGSNPVDDQAVVTAFRSQIKAFQNAKTQMAVTQVDQDKIKYFIKRIQFIKITDLLMLATFGAIAALNIVCTFLGPDILPLNLNLLFGAQNLQGLLSYLTFLFVPISYYMVGGRQYQNTQLAFMQLPPNLRTAIDHHLEDQSKIGNIRYSYTNICFNPLYEQYRNSTHHRVNEVLNLGSGVVAQRSEQIEYVYRINQANVMRATFLEKIPENIRLQMSERQLSDLALILTFDHSEEMSIERLIKYITQDPNSGYSPSTFGHYDELYGLIMGPSKQDTVGKPRMDEGRLIAVPVVKAMMMGSHLPELETIYTQHKVLFDEKFNLQAVNASTFIEDVLDLAEQCGAAASNRSIYQAAITDIYDTQADTIQKKLIIQLAKACKITYPGHQEYLAETILREVKKINMYEELIEAGRVVRHSDQAELTFTEKMTELSTLIKKYSKIAGLGLDNHASDVLSNLLYTHRDELFEVSHAVSGKAHPFIQQNKINHPDWVLDDYAVRLRDYQLLEQGVAETAGIWQNVPEPSSETNQLLIAYERLRTAQAQHDTVKEGQQLLLLQSMMKWTKDNRNYAFQNANYAWTPLGNSEEVLFYKTLFSEEFKASKGKGIETFEDIDKYRKKFSAFIQDDKNDAVFRKAYALSAINGIRSILRLDYENLGIVHQATVTLAFGTQETIKYADYFAVLISQKAAKIEAGMPDFSTDVLSAFRARNINSQGMIPYLHELQRNYLETELRNLVNEIEYTEAAQHYFKDVYGIDNATVPTIPAGEFHVLIDLFMQRHDDGRFRIAARADGYYQMVARNMVATRQAIEQIKEDISFVTLKKKIFEAAFSVEQARKQLPEPGKVSAMIDKLIDLYVLNSINIGGIKEQGVHSRMTWDEFEYRVFDALKGNHPLNYRKDGQLRTSRQFVTKKDFEYFGYDKRPNQFQLFDKEIIETLTSEHHQAIRNYIAAKHEEAKLKREASIKIRSIQFSESRKGIKSTFDVEYAQTFASVRDEFINIPKWYKPDVRTKDYIDAEIDQDLTRFFNELNPSATLRRNLAFGFLKTTFGENGTENLREGIRRLVENYEDTDLIDQAQINPVLIPSKVENLEVVMKISEITDRKPNQTSYASQGDVTESQAATMRSLLWKWVDNRRVNQADMPHHLALTLERQLSNRLNVTPEQYQQLGLSGGALAHQLLKQLQQPGATSTTAAQAVLNELLRKNPQLINQVKGLGAPDLYRVTGSEEVSFFKVTSPEKIQKAVLEILETEASRMQVHRKAPVYIGALSALHHISNLNLNIANPADIDQLFVALGVPVTQQNEYRDYITHASVILRLANTPDDFDHLAKASMRFNEYIDSDITLLHAEKKELKEIVALMIENLSINADLKKESPDKQIYKGPWYTYPVQIFSTSSSQQTKQFLDFTNGELTPKQYQFFVLDRPLTMEEQVARNNSRYGILLANAQTPDMLIDHGDKKQWAEMMRQVSHAIDSNVDLQARIGAIQMYYKELAKLSREARDFIPKDQNERNRVTATLNQGQGQQQPNQQGGNHQQDEDTLPLHFRYNSSVLDILLSRVVVQQNLIMAFAEAYPDEAKYLTNKDILNKVIQQILKGETDTLNEKNVVQTVLAEFLNTNHSTLDNFFDSKRYPLAHFEKNNTILMRNIDMDNITSEGQDLWAGSFIQNTVDKIVENFNVYLVQNYQWMGKKNSPVNWRGWAESMIWNNVLVSAKGQLGELYQQGCYYLIHTQKQVENAVITHGKWLAIAGLHRPDSRINQWLTNPKFNNFAKAIEGFRIRLPITFQVLRGLMIAGAAAAGHLVAPGAALAFALALFIAGSGVGTISNPANQNKAKNEQTKNMLDSSTNFFVHAHLAAMPFYGAILGYSGALMLGLIGWASAGAVMGGIGTLLVFQVIARNFLARSAVNSTNKVPHKSDVKKELDKIEKLLNPIYVPEFNIFKPMLTRLLAPQSQVNHKQITLLREALEKEFNKTDILDANEKWQAVKAILLAHLENTFETPRKMSIVIERLMESLMTYEQNEKFLKVLGREMTDNLGPTFRFRDFQTKMTNHTVLNSLADKTWEAVLIDPALAQHLSHLMTAWLVYETTRFDWEAAGFIGKIRLMASHEIAVATDGDITTSQVDITNSPVEDAASKPKLESIGSIGKAMNQEIAGMSADSSNMYVIIVQKTIRWYAATAALMGNYAQAFRKWRQLTPMATWARGFETLSYGSSFMIRDLIQVGMVLTAFSVTPIALTGLTPPAVLFAFIIGCIGQYVYKMRMDDKMREFMGHNKAEVALAAQQSFVQIKTSEEVFKQAPYLRPNRLEDFSVTIESPATTNSLFANPGTKKLIIMSLLFNFLMGYLALDGLNAMINGSMAMIIKDFVLWYWLNEQARRMSAALSNNIAIQGIANESLRKEPISEKVLKFICRADIAIKEDIQGFLPTNQVKLTALSKKALKTADNFYKKHNLTQDAKK